jgi:hypothetical protein
MVLMTKNWRKFTKNQKFVSLILLSNYNIPILRPPETMSKLQKNPPALKIEHQALQSMKFLNFFLHFCSSGFVSGYRSTDLIEFGSNPDPDSDPDLKH